MVRIVSDSTCDLSEEILNKYDIKMVPLHIVLGDKEYRDRVEITPSDIFKWADENKTTPKTSAIAFDDATKVIQPLVEAGDEVICFCISETMSTTGNVFRMVAEELDASDKVFVYNSKNLSNGVGILAIEAAIMAKDGVPFEDIITRLDEYRDKVNASFVIDTLTYLARGGRCTPVVALAGGILKIHPKIILEDGKMDVSKKYRGAMSVVAVNYAHDLEKAMLTSRKDRVFLISAGMDSKTVDEVRDYLISLNYYDEIIESVAGGVISSHCGPGTLGIMFVAQ